MRCYVECWVRSARARIARNRAGHSRFLTSPFAADVHGRSKFCRIEKLLPFMFSNLFLGQLAATQKNANESLRGARDELT